MVTSFLYKEEVRRMSTLNGSIAWTKRGLRVIHLAHEEARYAGATAIGREHILLGLLREGRGMGAEILRTMQVDEGVVRQALHLPRSPQVASSGITTNPLLRWLRRWRRSSSILPWDALRLNEQARQCLDTAMEEAQTLHVRFVGTEHLLFGIASVEEIDGDTEKALGRFHFHANQVHEQIVRLYRSANMMR